MYHVQRLLKEAEACKQEGNVLYARGSYEEATVQTFFSVCLAGIVPILDILLDYVFLL